LFAKIGKNLQTSKCFAKIFRYTLFSVGGYEEDDCGWCLGNAN